MLPHLQIRDRCWASERQDSVCRVLPFRQAFHALMAIATSASRPARVEY